MVQGPLYATSTANATTSSSTYQTTGLAVSITPMSAANLIRAQATGSVYSPQANTGGNGALFRDSTMLSENEQVILGAGATALFPITLHALDKPNSVSSLSYNVRIKSRTANNFTWNVDSLASPIEVMELQG